MAHIQKLEGFALGLVKVKKVKSRPITFYKIEAKEFVHMVHP